MPDRVPYCWECGCQREYCDCAAQGIEAAPAAETAKHGSVHESPVANGDAPKGGQHD